MGVTLKEILSAAKCLDEHQKSCRLLPRLLFKVAVKELSPLKTNPFPLFSLQHTLASFFICLVWLCHCSSLCSNNLIPEPLRTPLNTELMLLLTSGSEYLETTWTLQKSLHSSNCSTSKNAPKTLQKISLAYSCNERRAHVRTLQLSQVTNVKLLYMKKR